MLGNLTGLHLLLILAIVVLLFGAAKLPALAKGLGQSINVFKKEMESNSDAPRASDTNATNTTTTANTAPSATSAPVQHTEGQQAAVLNPGSSAQPNNDRN